jgi:dihydrolipoamide dehydrogenase
MKIVIIGGGPGGYVAAIRAAQLNAEVVLVEKERLGGTCLNKGCIPAKVLLHASGEFAAAKNFESYGIKIKGVELDWPEIQRRKSEIVDKQVKGIQSLLINNNVVIIKGEGSFLNKNQLKVKDKAGSETLVDFDYAIIASGSKPVFIPIPGAELPEVITSDEALNLTEIPSTMVIIGGGVIGCEFAEVFNAAGCKVTIIEMLPNIIANMDRDIVSTLRDKFYKTGVEVYTDTKVLSITKSKDGLAVNTESAGSNRSFSADKVLLAIGRRPVIDNLALENAGLVTKGGAILVNCKQIISVYGYTGYIVCGCPHGNIRNSLVSFLAYRNSVSVIFTHKYYRQFPNTSQIQGFMECTLVSGRISEKAYAYLVCFLVLNSQA